MGESRQFLGTPARRRATRGRSADPTWPPHARLRRPLAPVRAMLLVGLLLLAGCEASEAEADDAPLRVVASMSVIADFAEQVGGDRVEVTSIVPVGGDPHVHEPRPSDARRIAEADVVLANGLALEPWFDDLVGASGQPARYLGDELSATVRFEDDGEPDPHLWMVPAYAAGYVEAIRDHLVDADPDHAAEYERDAAAYLDELDRLDEELAERLSAIPPENRVLVTSHDAYAYFSDHFGLVVLGTVVGVSTDEEPSARRVREIVDAVRDSGVPTVFVETTVNPAVIERIARDTGARVGDPLYGDSLGEPGSGADTYAGMMRANVDALVDGLGR